MPPCDAQRERPPSHREQPMTCTTHHLACECREAAQSAEIQELTRDRDRLRKKIERLQEEHKDPVLVADDLFDDLMLELANGEPRYLDEEDDPEVLRECLRRQRLAAAAERLSHEARAVVAKVLVDPKDPLAAHIVITTPTGDRAHERAVGADLIRIAVANAMLAGFWQGFIRGIHELAEKTARGEVTAGDAWARVIDLIGDEEPPARASTGPEAP